MAGCFSWDSPRGKLANSPDPGPLHEELNYDERDQNIKPVTPDDDREKFRMKVAVEASDRKDDLDKDHIYVDNQKIYRPFRSPDLYGVRNDETSARSRSSSDNSFELIDGNLNEEGMKERLVFSDDNEKLKVKINNGKTGTDKHNEAEEKLRRLDVSGEAMSKNDIMPVQRNTNEKATDEMSKVYRYKTILVYFDS